MDINDAEGIHPLSPIQEAILWGTPDPHLACGQVECVLEGPLEATTLEKAAVAAAGRHPALRTFFLWKRVDRPLQVVHRRPPIAVERHDFSGLSAAQQQEELDACSRRERQRGFDVGKAPLVRLSLCRTGNAAHHLIITYHRTILDRDSARLFISDLFGAYSYDGQGDRSQGVPYSAYLAWSKGADASAAECFWRKTLEQVTAPTPVPMERSSATSQQDPDTDGERSRQLSSELVGRIKRVAKAGELRAETLLHAAWALLLSSYSGEADVIFGATVDTCPAHLREAGVMLGPLTNSRPIRIRIQPEIAVGRWLGEIDAQLRAIHSHVHSSLVSIHRLANPPFATPLFETCVDSRGARATDAPVQRYGKIAVRRVRESTPEFALMVEGDLESGVVRIEYDRRRIDEDLVAGVLEHIEFVLSGLAAESDRRVSEVPVLTDTAKRQLLVDWNSPETLYPDKCVHWLFEAQVKRTPATLSVMSDDEQLTYRELDERSNRLAHYLQRLGVGPEVLVAICMEKSADLIIAILGVLKSGGAWIPLDPAYPADRLAFMLEDAQPPVLLTQERTLNRLPSYLGQALCLDLIRDEIERESMESPTSAVGGDNLAYVMYTSGSTGKPKGAMVHHRGICNTCEQMVEVFDQKPGTRLLQFASVSFDMSVLDILPALISGETLCLTRQEPILGNELGRLLEERAIQALTIPPSVLATVPESELPELELIRVAGEAVPEDLVASWQRGRRFYNAYGPAEGSIWVSGAYLDDTSSPHIGRPIANIQIYVLDSSLQLVPPGVQGELCFGGVGVGRGYLNRPDLTAEKFVPNPFSKEPGERLYRTGDLARHLPDGNLEFLGRKDEQIKLNGFRIELGEIEAHLAEHPSVHQGAVVLRDDGPGEKRLVAYAVPHPGRDVTSNELRTYLRTKLPATMIPAAFVFLESMPLSVNGKLDRKALPVPEVERTGSRASYVAPRNATEETTAKIFGEVLGVERVGVTDNFFDLGGHSLLAAKLLSRIRAEFGVDLPLAQVFRGPTVADLSELIDNDANHETDSRLPPIVAIARASRQGYGAEQR
jgi:amino acid adenylation domain-containing protein